MKVVNWMRTMVRISKILSGVDATVILPDGKVFVVHPNMTIERQLSKDQLWQFWSWFGARPSRRRPIDSQMA